MDPLLGFATVPRPAGSPRPAGAFFSATVLQAAGPGSWTVKLDGTVVTVRTTVALTPGQHLRLHLVAQTEKQWRFELMNPLPAQPPVWTSLMQTFVARGLPAAAEKLGAWARWVQASGPSDREAWAAGLEARAARPGSELEQAVAPWLQWQTALEQGQTPPPPDEAVWDDWNLRTPPGQPWVVMPLHWEYQGHRDSGLLQAHWNAPAQRIDTWTLTAAPAGHPFRLEARTGERLGLRWLFFRDADAQAARRWARSAPLPPDIDLAIETAGPQPLTPTRGIDVRA